MWYSVHFSILVVIFLWMDVGDMKRGCSGLHANQPARQFTYKSKQMHQSGTWSDVNGTVLNKPTPEGQGTYGKEKTESIWTLLMARTSWYIYIKWEWSDGRFSTSHLWQVFNLEAETFKTTKTILSGGVRRPSCTAGAPCLWDIIHEIYDWFCWAHVSY